MSDEKHFTPSNSSIECTGCEGKISNLISTTPTVFVKKQPMATIKDKLPTSFKPFPSCSLSSSGTCTPSPIGKWKTQDVLEKIDIQKQTPIIEGNYIKCFAKPGTGIITISEKKDTPPPPENIIDKAQNKINKAANYATKKITEITKAASNAIGGIADTAKKAGGFLNNESIQGAVSSASDLVDNIDRKKAELDVTVANANIRLNNLRKELKELITGEQQQLQDLMTINDSEEDTATPLEESPIEAEPDTNNTPETEAEEYAYNQDFFNETNRESVNALMDDMQSDLDTLNNSASRLEPEKDFTIETDKGSADSTRLFTESGEANATSSNSNSITTSTLPSSSDILQESISNNDAEGLQAATDRYNETNAILQEHGVTIGNPEDKQETIQSLVLLDNITEILEGGPNASGLANNLTTSSNTGLDVNGNPLIISEQATSNVPNLSLDRNNEKTQELNTKVQAKIDELLQEVEYLEKLQKYQQESKELQEDLDRSAAALDVLGDFGAFVDGIAAEYLGELADEYKEVMDQIGKNMSRLNDSLRGASFIAGGLKAGDVITHAPDLEKPQEEEGPPPELPPPPPPQEIEEEEEEEEEDEDDDDECTFTKLTAIKNNTLEYVIIEKEGDRVIFEQPIDKPITFVAGTDQDTKKDFSLKIENLHRDPEHRENFLIYKIDGDTKQIEFPDGNPELKFDVNYKDSFFEEGFLLLNLMGYLVDVPFTHYNIPINICSFQETIDLNVYPDAEWSLLFSLGSDDPLTYTHGNKPPGDIFKDHQDIARKIGRINSRKINGGNRTATFQFQYGVAYNGGNSSKNLSFNRKYENLYALSQGIFSYVGAIDSIADYLRGDFKDNTSNASVSIATIPPSIFFGWNHKILPSDKLFENKSENILEFGLDPLIGAEIKVDFVKTAKDRVPLLIFISKALKLITDRELSDVFFFFVELSCNFKLIGKIDVGNSSNNSARASFEYAMKITIGFHLEGSFWGIEYEAHLEGRLAGGLEISAVVATDNSGLYAQGEANFNGIQGTVIIKGSVSGWFIDEHIEKEWTGTIGKWDAPKKTDKLRIN